MVGFEPDAGDDFAMGKRGVLVRRAAGQAVEVGKGDFARAIRPLDFYRCIQCGEGRTHVGGVDRDAGIGCTQDGVNTVETADRRTTAAGLTLVVG